MFNKYERTSKIAMIFLTKMMANGAFVCLKSSSAKRKSKK